MPNVKLAVRIRPFTERELRLEQDRVPVVSVLDDNTITITNIKVNSSGAGDSRQRVRTYYADYTLDSACSEMLPGYATQEKVFDSIGREVVACEAQGASACVLAYGQSATGKTHTMMGSDTQPGLVPRLCRALAADTADSALDLTVSFLEIYNERVHDLLAEGRVACHSLPRRRGNARKDLRVREHPSRGPYVQNLRRVAVHDVDTLLSLVEEGAKRRRTAATRRNPTSSRSHALLELSTPRATLHLADLAGSEKASWEGCGRGTQKEGANINKSLVALSNVISALVSGGHRGRFVPYRDSALTWLLKDCFTGGASTFIIATVSPSAACYGESASTLRWAARARQLPTPRVSTAVAKNSRVALQTQLNHLLAELARHHIRYIPDTGTISYDDSHWTLDSKYIQLCDTSNKEAKIGNIMNMFNPKADANTSESTASSAASGSSEVINTVDKDVNIKDEISKEVDKLFGPTLERTKSGSDLEVIAPLRNKRRQYKSQEVLPMDKTLLGYNTDMTKAYQSQQQINETEEMGKVKPHHVPILYDNQRAEIVASVTERLYSKLKKKEESAVSKMENMVDKKIMEPLSELKICTNARQRLMELSQKAMRNKRRIGIPAYTQTKRSVTRVRDQGIDVQTDLDYIVKNTYSCTLQRDVATETTPVTPRCKEIAIGPQYGALDFRDRSTITENYKIISKNSFMMTDVVPLYNSFTQTPILPPPRRKRRQSNCIKHVQCDNSRRNYTEECAVAPVISINISQQYAVDSESQSSDDNLVILNNKSSTSPITVTATPDLLTNHNTVEDNIHNNIHSVNFNHVEDVPLKPERYNIESHATSQATSQLQREDNEDFTDSEELMLPRVKVDPSRLVNHEGIKDMILGRDENQFPYNIILSPPREKEGAKRIVQFKDANNAAAQPVNSQIGSNSENNGKSKSQSSSDVTNSEKEYDTSKDSHVSTYSDSTDSSKVEAGSFIWKKGGNDDQYHKTYGSLNSGYTPVYKSNSKYKTARTKFYKDFLGLDKNEAINITGESRPEYSSLLNVKNISSSDTDNERSINKFRQKKQYFEDKFKRNYTNTDDFRHLERNVFESCKSLDATVNRYENYLAHCHNNDRQYCELPSRTPTEYLKHLVQLRREVVKADCDTTDSSVVLKHK